MTHRRRSIRAATLATAVVLAIGAVVAYTIARLATDRPEALDAGSRASGTPTVGRPGGSAAAATAGEPAGDDALVTVGSPPTEYPRSRQGEPSIAIDPADPSVVVAGANDLIDVAPCGARSRGACRGSRGVGVSGIYFSFDAGRTWRQPEYQGWSARDGTPGRGPIGTLPRYRGRSVASHGDPSVAFGPRPGDDGTFSWTNGSRLYYANLASPFRKGRAPFQGRSAIAVSRTDDPAAAADGNARAWRRPVFASGRLGEGAFHDKEAIWSDRASSSPHFGNVYLCWTAFRARAALAASIVFSRSTDGGGSWSRPIHLTTGRNSVTQGGRQACAVRTDSAGRVYVVWWDTPRDVDDSIQVIARSTDGGRSFSQPRTIADVDDVGTPDPLAHDRTFDGVGGSRTNSFPSLSIADGAPDGRNATDAIAVAWADASRRRGPERAVIAWSHDAGRTWSRPRPASPRDHRAAMPAVALAPHGAAAHLVYDAHLREWRERALSARPVRGVVRSAQSPRPRTIPRWVTRHEAAIGDARAGTLSTLTAGGLYDYNSIDAIGDLVVAAWNDVREGRVCPAADRYRQARLNGSDRPRPRRSVCPGRFGNIDVFATSLTGPVSAPGG